MSYESLQRSPDAIKKDGLVAEGKGDKYSEFYTFPRNYEVNRERINSCSKTFCDPVRRYITQQQSFRNQVNGPLTLVHTPSNTCSVEYTLTRL
jgi:hypothetical protein